nr:hypothetical protein GCM10020093_093660 [Planobispora longispora]
MAWSHIARRRMWAPGDDIPAGHGEDGAMVEEGTRLWEPTPEIVRDAKVTRYMEWLGRPVDYQALWQWSVDAPAEFWTSVWDYFEVAGARGDGPVISGTMPGVEWFTGSTVNYAENALRRAASEPGRSR